VDVGFWFWIAEVAFSATDDGLLLPGTVTLGNCVNCGDPGLFPTAGTAPTMPPPVDPLPDEGVELFCEPALAAAEGEAD